MKKRIIALACAVAVSACMFTGCGGEKPKTSGNADAETLALTAYDSNVKISFGNDDVSKEIIKKTGVTLNYTQTSGDAKEKLNLMLASNDYPNLISIGRSTGLIDKFISAKALIPLDDLIEQYGPNIKEEYGEYLDRAKSEDGHIYGLPNWYGLDNEPVLGFMIRKDLLAEFAPPEVVNADRPMTQDEFIQYLKAFQTKYPTIDGKAGVPMTLWAENWGSFMGTFKGMYGLKTYTETDGKLSYDFRDPKYKEMLKYMNGIFQSGLLDKEWATNKEQLWKQKMASGAVFATAEAYWNTEDANKVLKEKGEDCIFLPYQVVANGVDPKKTTYSSRNPMGWDVIGITKSNPNPEKTIKFLDFLASDEGQKLIMGGVEGKQYDVVDGKRVMKPEVIEKVTEDFTAYSKETGVRYWTMCVKNGKAKDGQAFQLSNEYIPNPVKDFALKSLDGTVWDCSPYEDLTPVGGSIDALNYQKISDLSLEYCTKLVNAANDDEFEKLWSSFISEADALGAQKVEEILNQNYQKKMKLWGMDK